MFLIILPNKSEGELCVEYETLFVCIWSCLLFCDKIKIKYRKAAVQRVGILQYVSSVIRLLYSNIAQRINHNRDGRIRAEGSL